MTDSNPTGVAPLQVGETVSSASPKVELGKAKAIVAAVGGVVVAVAAVLPGALADGAIDLNEGISLVLAILVGLGVPGVGTYLTPTTVTRKR